MRLADAMVEEKVPEDYARAKARRDELEAESSRAGRALRALSGGGSMGKTPDHVRETPEWKAAKRDSDVAFAALQAFNTAFTSRFKREIAQDRRR